MTIEREGRRIIGPRSRGGASWYTTVRSEDGMFESRVRTLEDGRSGAMLVNDTFYVTTPIYYVNSDPHLGHAYTTILADVLSRFHRLAGKDSRMQTGTDEHGEKIARAAREQGMSPQDFVDQVSAKFVSLWKKLDIEPSVFLRTTDDAHRAVVRRILENVHDRGDIYFDHYDGLYCVGCERYVTDKELVDGKCADHDREPEKRSESNWFFRMEKYRGWLKQHIEEHPDFIQPEGFRRETLSLLDEPIGDLSISRPKERVPWGIPIPWDTNHVTYVWFDALINYVSGLGWPDSDAFATYWPSSTHLIAKDILKPHCIFWPCMLKAAGIEPYQNIRIHGYWLMDQGKMSKSRGNVVKPLDLVDSYGIDPFRYFLMRDMTFGRDATFSELALVERMNADLANDLGNLLNRTLGMIGRYHEGLIRGAGDLQEEDEAFRERVVSLVDPVQESFSVLRFSVGIESIMELVRATNRYIDSTEPWRLAKEGNHARLETVLSWCAESLRVVSILLEPIMPHKMVELRQQLGMTDPGDVRLADARQFPAIAPGARVSKAKPIFPRVDVATLRTTLVESVESKPDDTSAPEVSYDDFMRIHVVTARVVECAKVPKADKLLRCVLDAGELGKPVVIAGLASWYEPDQLVGKMVLWLSNLAPKKIRGVLSRGMILAVDCPDGTARIIDAPDGACPGMRVR